MSEFTNKNIWVFIETDEGKAKSVGLELLNPGRMLAEKSGEKLVAVVFGKDNAEAIEQVKGYGPDQVISVSGGEYEKYSFDAYTYAMTSLVEKYQPIGMKVAALLDAGDPLAATLGPIAKCYCSDALNRVTTEAVQILGGYGYMRDYPVEKLMRDAKIFQIFEGTNEIQRVVISGNVIRKNKIK